MNGRTPVGRRPSDRSACSTAREPVPDRVRGASVVAGEAAEACSGAAWSGAAEAWPGAAWSGVAGAWSG
ncbi:MAG: hypothetical protein ACRDT6_28945, partial [Micromonosporaceae bacterium]